MLIRKQVYVAKRQETLLKALAKTTGIKWSEHLRRALDEYLDKNKELLEKS